MKGSGLSREVPVRRGATALLIVDVQNYSARGGKRYAGLAPEEVEANYGYFFRQMSEHTIPNIQRLQSSCRASGVEVLYTVIESLTMDGREMSLDYKISGLFCPKGSHDAHVIDAISPQGDEMVIPKSSSSPFISTNIHFVLGNLGVRHLIVCGVLTDQCVDSTVRDACDYGYLVTLVTDACATQTEERHAASISNNRGYCRQLTTNEMVSELATIQGPPPAA